MFVPVVFVLGGLATLIYAMASKDEPPDHEPDLPPMPGSTGYRRVDAMLPQLTAAAAQSGIPLGVLVGWIAKESGGKLEEVTKLNERGVFQLMPEESQTLGLDHERLSTDLAYSIAAGVTLIRSYMRKVANLDVVPRGSAFFWKLVKLWHTVGGGDTTKMVLGAKAVGQMDSWESFEQYALSGQTHVKHSPKKWYPFVAQVFACGLPFGVESSTSVVGGQPAYTDIPDVLALLPHKGRG